ncbi:hypothetical protein H4Q26_007719 [Puccinia striiformis f. sp. tritici PST-130]|nr:hypothetical protein H4Q26_007719 [Puccinia striiformis f. sp. tritici PST-130]
MAALDIKPKLQSFLIAYKQILPALFHLLHHADFLTFRLNRIDQPSQYPALRQSKIRLVFRAVGKRDGSNPDLSETRYIGDSNYTEAPHNIKRLDYGLLSPLSSWVKDTNQSFSPRDPSGEKETGEKRHTQFCISTNLNIIGRWHISTTPHWQPSSRFHLIPRIQSIRWNVGNTYQYHDHQHPNHYGPQPDDGDQDLMLESQSQIAHHGTLAATSALSAWGSIPWDVPSSIPNRSAPGFNFLDPEITAAVRNRDRNASHQRKDDAWQKLMGKLFPVYMWLKVKTQNWTATNALDSFSTKFCKCGTNTPRIKQWIDLVDLVGQQRMLFTFCKCIPRPVQILANGFLASSPSEPTAAFSMRLLAYHNHAWHHSNVRMAPFSETQQLFNEERSETLWNKSQTAVSVFSRAHRLRLSVLRSLPNPPTGA